MIGGQVRLDVADELELLGFEQRSSGGDGALDDFLDGDVGHVPGEFAGFDLGQVENVVDELGEAFAFADDDVEIFDDLGAWPAAPCGRLQGSAERVALRGGGE